MSGKIFRHFNLNDWWSCEQAGIRTDILLQNITILCIQTRFHDICFRLLVLLRLASNGPAFILSGQPLAGGEL